VDSDAEQGSRNGHIQGDPIMIGEIEFTKGKKKHRAALEDSLTWRCSDREVESLLNDMYPAVEAQTEAPENVRRLLYQASSRLGGKVKAYR